MSPKKDKCKVCKQRVSGNPKIDEMRGIKCRKCQWWLHYKCGRIVGCPTEDEEWFCPICKEVIAKENATECYVCEETFAPEDSRKCCKTCSHVIHANCGSKDWTCQECAPPDEDISKEFEVPSCGGCGSNVDCEDDGHQCEECDVWFHNRCMTSELRCQGCLVKQTVKKGRELLEENSKLKDELSEADALTQVQEKEIAELKDYSRRNQRKLVRLRSLVAKKLKDKVLER
jgi:hypothetical protein